MTPRYTRAKRRQGALEKIVTEHAGRNVEVCFVGSHASHNNRAKVYSYIGVLALVDGKVEVTTSQGTIARHASKVVSIRLMDGGLTLFGQYCRHCQIGVPAKYGNCQDCTRKLVVGSLYH
ncbi:hypothetical protein [Vibrio phage vB_VpS_PG28]|nr:hypothetical protein [Vibrio phage vB_VpS_PG28]